ncbi:MAG: hypothetical protein ACO3JL_19555, partial [Myxococcota bacterium]
MKGLDLNEELELASGMVNSPRAFIAGGGILLVAYLVGIVIELMKMNSGGKPEWSKPLLRLVMFSALLGSYALVAKGIIMTVSSFGNLQSVNVDTQSIFAARAEAFSRLLAKTSEADLSFAEMASASFVEALMQVGTFFAYAFAAGMIWLIKVLQKVMIATLLSLGPIMIGFAAIPGVTGKYLGAWAFALVEVSAWGITGSVLLRLMNQSFGSLTIDPDVTPNLAEHIVFCLMYAGAFGLIPLITSMILRGAPMANIAMTGQGFAAALPAAQRPWRYNSTG